MNVKIYYPAVFQKEDTGYSVWVPDIEGCVSQGENLSEAMENIADAIGLALETRAEHGLDIPAPSSPEKIKTEENQFVSAVPFDPAEIMKAARNEEYLSKIDKAIEQLSAGKGQRHELIEVE